MLLMCSYWKIINFRLVKVSNSTLSWTVCITLLTVDYFPITACHIVLCLTYIPKYENKNIKSYPIIQGTFYLITYTLECVGGCCVL